MIFFSMQELSFVFFPFIVLSVLVPAELKGGSLLLPSSATLFLLPIVGKTSLLVVVYLRQIFPVPLAGKNSSLPFLPASAS